MSFQPILKGDLTSHGTTVPNSTITSVKIDGKAPSPVGIPFTNKCDIPVSSAHPGPTKTWIGGSSTVFAEGVALALVTVSTGECTCIVPMNSSTVFIGK